MKKYEKRVTNVQKYVTIITSIKRRTIQMKKVISIVLVCVLLACSVFALASCGKTLSGTYKDALTGLTELTFKGNKVTITVRNGSTTANYEIKENEDGKTVTSNSHIRNVMSI